MRASLPPRFATTPLGTTALSAAAAGGLRLGDNIADCAANRILLHLAPDVPHPNHEGSQTDKYGDVFASHFRLPFRSLTPQNNLSSNTTVRIATTKAVMIENRTNHCATAAPRTTHHRLDRQAAPAMHQTASPATHRPLRQARRTCGLVAVRMAWGMNLDTSQEFQKIRYGNLDAPLDQHPARRTEQPESHLRLRGGCL